MNVQRERLYLPIRKVLSRPDYITELAHWRLGGGIVSLVTGFAAIQVTVENAAMKDTFSLAICDREVIGRTGIHRPSKESCSTRAA